MLKKLLNTYKKKSPKERFLFVTEILFFSLYLFIGIGVIFWHSIFAKKFPIEMQSNYRIALGVVLIVYSFLRFNRFVNSNND